MARMFRRRGRRSFGRRRRFVRRNVRFGRKRFGRKRFGRKRGHKSIARKTYGHPPPKFANRKLVTGSKQIWGGGNTANTFITRNNANSRFADVQSTDTDTKSVFYSWSTIFGGDVNLINDTARQGNDPFNWKLFGSANQQNGTGRKFQLWLYQLMGINDFAGAQNVLRNTFGKVSCDWMRITVKMSPRLYLEETTTPRTTMASFPPGVEAWWAYNSDINYVSSGTMHDIGEPKLVKAKPDKDGYYTKTVFWRNKLPINDRWISPVFFSCLEGAPFGLFNQNARFPYSAGKYLTNMIETYVAPNTVSQHASQGPQTWLGNADFNDPGNYSMYGIGLPVSTKFMDMLCPESNILRLPALKVALPGDHNGQHFTLTMDTSYDVTAGFRGMAHDSGKMDGNTVQFQVPLAPLGDNHSSYTCSIPVCIPNVDGPSSVLA